MLSNKDQEALAYYFAGRAEVAAAFLFGSQASGRSNAASDVDIAILFHWESNREDLRLSELITDLIGILRRQDVDVAILNDASPVLLREVAVHGHVIYSENEEIVAEFGIWALQQYEDTRPLRRLQDELIEQRLARLRALDSGGK